MAAPDINSVKSSISIVVGSVPVSCLLNIYTQTHITSYTNRTVQIFVSVSNCFVQCITTNYCVLMKQAMSTLK